MKRFELLLFVLLGFLTLSNSALAQSGRVKDAAATPLTTDTNKPSEAKPADLNDSRTAAQLFEDADNYSQKKFAEFEKRKMPYDQRLEEKIKQEQRDLAAQHASLLAARKLEGQDVYYLGLLYNLARNFDAALEAMRRFLTESKSATGEPAQNARAIIVIQAAKKDCCRRQKRVSPSMRRTNRRCPTIVTRWRIGWCRVTSKPKTTSTRCRTRRNCGRRPGWPGKRKDHLRVTRC